MSGTGAKLPIDESIVLDAEYSEDRWKLKNRVIYVGADGKILADVSEGAGDLPVVVHDPYLTDPKEAERRAKIRLALNKEYGRSLRITIHQKDFKSLGIDLGDVCLINLPSVGLENVYMVLLGIEYDPRSFRYRLEFGGRKELLEDWLDEQIGGDVARRFGKAMTLPEQTSTLAYSLDKIARIQADQKHVIYVNKPPLTLYNAQNIILNSDGEAELTSGATEGSFEVQVLPPSQLFVNWVKAEWIAEKNDGEISVQFLNVDGETLGQVYDAYDTQFYRFKKWPQGYGFLTYKNAENWFHRPIIADKKMGILHAYCLRMEPTIHFNTIIYPKFKSREKHYDNSGWIEFGKDYLIVDSMQSGEFWSNSDTGSALFLDMSGWEIIVKVLDPGVTQGGTGKWMRLLMLRSSLDPGSRFLAILFDRDASHLTLCWRDSEGASAQYMGDDTGSPWDGTTPFYLRLTLKSEFEWHAYWSKDLSNWNHIGYHIFDAFVTHIGLCATKHGTGRVKYSRTIWIDGEQYFIPEPLRLDLSWAKWIRLYLYADSEDDAMIKIRLHQDEDNYFEGSLLVKAKEWRKYEISMDSLSQIGSPSLSNINWISIISSEPILIDSDHVFLPATRELMRVKFTLKRDSPSDESPKIKLVKVIWREGA